MGEEQNDKADGTAGPAPAQVQSVDRALSVLDLLAQRGEVGVTELAVDLAVHKSTAFRLVTALERRQLVEQVGDRGKYRLGLGILRLAAATVGRLDVTRESQSICERLANELGETVNVAILNEGSAVNVMQEFGNAAIGSRNWIGRRTPLHATSSGKVLLAYADPALRASVLAEPLERFTEQTVTDPVELSRLLDDIRERGWAWTDEELEIGLAAIAAPLRDGSGRVSGALSISGPSYRLPPSLFGEIAPQLLEGAAEISSRLGYFPSNAN